MSKISNELVFKPSKSIFSLAAMALMETLNIKDVKLELDGCSEHVQKVPDDYHIHQIIPCKKRTKPICFGPKTQLRCPRPLEEVPMPYRGSVDQPEEPWALNDSILKTQRIPK